MSSSYLQQLTVDSLIYDFCESYSKVSPIYCLFGMYSMNFDELFKLALRNSLIKPKAFPTADTIYLNLSK